MTTDHPNNSEFLTALAQFETCLEVPIVPGELKSWLIAAQESCSQLRKILRDEITRTHADLIAEIYRQDMALVPRVEELQSKDAELTIRWEALHDELEQLSRTAEQTAEHAASHEANLRGRVEQVTASGLGLVIESRKQEAALATWYMEAFTRDRGVAD